MSAFERMIAYAISELSPTKLSFSQWAKQVGDVIVHLTEVITEHEDRIAALERKAEENR